MSVAALLIMLVTLSAALDLSGRRRRLHWFIIVFAAVLAVGSAALLWKTTFSDTHVLTTIRHGIAIRLALWNEAVVLMISHFPFGIGPGQFGELGLREYDLWLTLSRDTILFLGIDLGTIAFGWVPIRFVHITVLSMLVEWGVVALILIAFLIALISRSIAYSNRVAAICYGIYLMPTLLLHDGLGFRANIYFLGFGFVAFIGAINNKSQPTE